MGSPTCRVDYGNAGVQAPIYCLEIRLTRKHAASVIGTSFLRIWLYISTTNPTVCLFR